MNLVRPADFAAFVTDEFAPHAEAYCTLFWAAQSPESNTDLQSLFFNHVNGIRSQFQLIFAAVRRGDSPEQIRAKARRVADYLDLLYVHRIISGHSAHPSELDAVVRDLIPKLRDADDLEAVTGLLSAELAGRPGRFRRRQRPSGSARTTAGRSTTCSPGSPPSPRPSAASLTGSASTSTSSDPTRSSTSGPTTSSATRTWSRTAPPSTGP